MPTYSYRCANCDHAFDQYQAFTDDSLTVCPNCHQAQLRKVFNSIGVTFNGTGFYRTDARADAKAASKSSGSGDSASGSGSKSDAKPETKSEPSSAPSTPAKAPAAVSSSAS